MERTYYPFYYRLNATNHFLIWFTNDHDGLVMDRRGFVPCFVTEHHLRAYAHTEQLTLADDLHRLHNLDILSNWLHTSLSRPVPCRALLTAWNLFDDLSRSVGVAFEGDRVQTQPLYNKVFWGNNLPVFTPKGKRYIPGWSTNERLLLRRTLANGLRLFRRYVRVWQDS